MVEEDEVQRNFDAAIGEAATASDTLPAEQVEMLSSIASELRESLRDCQAERLVGIRAQLASFRENNGARWRRSFEAMHLFRDTSSEAARTFQAEALKHEGYETAPKFGALLRLQARAVRIFGEVLALMEAGYADGALSRWRSLHELAVTAILLSKHDRKMSERFLVAGQLAKIRGMQSYQRTAEEMGREQFPEDEVQAAMQFRDELIAQYGTDLERRNGWAQADLGFTRFTKLQEAAG